MPRNNLICAKRQQFYPPFLLHHQCKCQHSEKDITSEYSYENNFALSSSEKVQEVQGSTDHTLRPAALDREYNRVSEWVFVCPAPLDREYERERECVLFIMLRVSSWLCYMAYSVQEQMRNSERDILVKSRPEFEFQVYYYLAKL